MKFLYRSCTAHWSLSSESRRQHRHREGQAGITLISGISLMEKSLHELHFDRSPFGQEGVPSDMASLWCLAWPLCESHFDRTPLGLEGVSADLNTNTSNWWHFGKGKVLAISQSSAKLMHNLIWCTLMIWEQRPSHTKSSTEHRFPESLSTSFVSMSCQIPCPMHLLPCTNFLLANPCLFLQELCSPSLFFPQSTKTWFCLWASSFHCLYLSPYWSTVLRICL